MTSLSRALLLGMVCAGLMAATILLRGQIWTPRADQLVLLWGFGGFFGAGLTLASHARISRLGWTRLATAVRLLGFLPAFAVVASLVFLVLHQINNGRFELNPDRMVMSFIFSSSQVIALFLYSLPPQLFPLLGPAMVLCGWLVLFRLARRGG